MRAFASDTALAAFLAALNADDEIRRAAGNHADGRRPLAFEREDAVQHVIQRAVAAERDHEIVASFRRARGQFHGLAFRFLHDDIRRPSRRGQHGDDFGNPRQVGS